MFLLVCRSASAQTPSLFIPLCSSLTNNFPRVSQWCVAMVTLVKYDLVFMMPPPLEGKPCCAGMCYEEFLRCSSIKMHSSVFNTNCPPLDECACEDMKTWEHWVFFHQVLHWSSLGKYIRLFRNNHKDNFLVMYNWSFHSKLVFNQLLWSHWNSYTICDSARTPCCFTTNELVLWLRQSTEETALV